MSRPLSVLEEAPIFGFDRETAPMDGERVYFQLALEDDESAASGQTLADIVGRTVIDMSDGAEGVLRVTDNFGTPVYWLDSGQQGGIGRNFTVGAQLLNPLTRELYAVGAGGRLTTTKLTDSDLRRTGVMGDSDSGDQAAAARQAAADAEAWRRQQALLEAQAAEAEANRDFETAERLADEAFRAGENAKALENQMKQTLIGEAGALQRTQLQLKGQARDLIAELYGKDDLRAALRQGGQVARGTTPHMAFMSQLGQTRDAPIQQVDTDMTIEELEAAIGTLQGNQALPTPNPMGIAGRAGGGPVAKGQAVRVGELGEEIVINEGGGRMRVIPIVANAAEGGEFDFDSQAIGQMMDRIYSHLGIPSNFTLRDTGRGMLPEVGGVSAWAAGQPGALELADRLGTNPRLIRSSSERQLGQDPNQGMFWVDQDGVAHQMTPQQAEAWGFNTEDFMFAHPSEIGSNFQIGNALQAAPPTQERDKGRFPLQPGPLRLPEELGSFAVMTPRTIANLYRNFTPTQRDILLNVLEISGFGNEEDMLNEIQAFTPTGTAGAVAFG